jgi:serine protease Do
VKKKPHGSLLLLASLAVAVILSSVGPVEARSTSETIEYILPRTVKIFGAGGLAKLASYGTGFLVSKDGHIVTVWSHVLDPDEVSVVLDDGRRFPAKVLGAEPPLDLAVLKIDAPDRDLDLPHFNLDTEIGTASAGARVLGFSNMFKVATGDEPVSVLHGVVMSRTKLRARRGTYQIPYDGEVYVVDAITNNSGAAGGILTTRDGKLLGMIGRELRNSQTNTWVNYSIPLTVLKTPVQEIISGNFTSTQKPLDDPGAAARYHPRDFGIVMIPDVLFRTPAYVDMVVAGSPAKEAGLKPDDLILFVNDELMQSVRMTKKELGRLEAGDRLSIVVRRKDQLQTFEFSVPKKEKPTEKEKPSGAVESPAP